MQIGSINNTPSFGKVIIEKGSKTKNQKKLIKKILKNPLLTKKLVNDLEMLGTDIYIKPSADGETVGIKLLTDIDFFGRKVIPYEGRYNTQLKTTINPNLNGELYANIAISNFLKRAGELDFGSDKNIELVKKAMQDPNNSENL